jgi:hypothetical protein
MAWMSGGRVDDKFRGERRSLCSRHGGPASRQQLYLNRLRIYRTRRHDFVIRA